MGDLINEREGARTFLLFAAFLIPSLKVLAPSPSISQQRGGMSCVSPRHLLIHA